MVVYTTEWKIRFFGFFCSFCMCYFEVSSWFF